MIIQQLDRYSWPVITECQYENDLHIVTDREHMNEICNSKFAKGMQPFMTYDIVVNPRRSKYFDVNNFVKDLFLLTTSRSERRSVVEDGSNGSALSSSRTSISVFVSLSHSSATRCLKLSAGAF